MSIIILTGEGPPEEDEDQGGESIQNLDGRSARMVYSEWEVSEQTEADVLRVLRDAGKS